MITAILINRVEIPRIGVLFFLLSFFLFSCGGNQNVNPTSEAFEAYEAGRFEEAIKLLNGKFEAEKLNMQSLTLRGKSYFYLGEFEKAASDFEQLQKLNLLSHETSYYLAQAYDSLQFIDLADVEYSRLLESDSTNVSYLLKSASVKKRLGDLKSAKDKYFTVIRLDSSNHLAFNNLGVLYEIEMNYSDAVKCYGKALEFNSEESFYYFNRGVAYLYQSEYQLALEDLNLAIKIENGNGRFHLNRGFAFYYLGDLSNACLDWKQAYSLNELESEMYIEKYCQKRSL